MLQLLQLLCLSCTIPNMKAWNIKNFYSIPLSMYGSWGTCAELKTAWVWKTEDGSKYGNIQGMDSFLDMSGVTYLNNITTLFTCKPEISTAEPLNWPERSCRWQDIHLEAKGEGCTIQRIEERMKGHFVPCREDELQAHITLDPVSSKAWALPCFWRGGLCCRKRRVSTNDVCLWNVWHVEMTWGGRREQLIFSSSPRIRSVICTFIEGRTVTKPQKTGHF